VTALYESNSEFVSEAEWSEPKDDAGGGWAWARWGELVADVRPPRLTLGVCSGWCCEWDGIVNAWGLSEPNGAGRWCSFACCCCWGYEKPEPWPPTDEWSNASRPEGNEPTSDDRASSISAAEAAANEAAGKEATEG
jgi:hypothetical protein